MNKELPYTVSQETQAAIENLKLKAEGHDVGNLPNYNPRPFKGLKKAIGTAAAFATFATASVALADTKPNKSDLGGETGLPSEIVPEDENKLEQGGGQGTPTPPNGEVRPLIPGSIEELEANPTFENWLLTNYGLEVKSYFNLYSQDRTVQAYYVFGQSAGQEDQPLEALVFFDDAGTPTYRQVIETNQWIDPDGFVNQGVSYVSPEQVEGEIPYAMWFRVSDRQGNDIEPEDFKLNLYDLVTEQVVGINFNDQDPSNNFIARIKQAHGGENEVSSSEIATDEFSYSLSISSVGSNIRSEPSVNSEIAGHTTQDQVDVLDAFAEDELQRNFGKTASELRAMRDGYGLIRFEEEDGEPMVLFEDQETGTFLLLDGAVTEGENTWVRLQNGGFVRTDAAGGLTAEIVKPLPGVEMTRQAALENEVFAEAISELPDHTFVIESTGPTTGYAQRVGVNQETFRVTEDGRFIALNEAGQIAMEWRPNQGGWAIPQFETQFSRFYLDTDFSDDEVNMGIRNTCPIGQVCSPDYVYNIRLLRNGNEVSSYPPAHINFTRYIGTEGNHFLTQDPTDGKEAIDNTFLLWFSMLKFGTWQPTAEQIESIRDAYQRGEDVLVGTSRGDINLRRGINVVFGPGPERGAGWLQAGIWVLPNNFLQISESGEATFYITADTLPGWGVSNYLASALSEVLEEEGIPSQYEKWSQGPRWPVFRTIYPEYRGNATTLNVSGMGQADREGRISYLN